MKLKIFTLFFICVTVLFSCKKKKEINLTDGYKNVQKKIIEKFGVDAHYTDISINKNKESEITIDLLITNNPGSYKMEGWSYSRDGWNQVSKVNLELSQGNIDNYMFQFNEEVSIIAAGRLIKLSIRKLKDKQAIKTTLKELKIISPHDGDKSKMKYEIKLESETNQIFSFSYDLSGKLMLDPSN